MRWDCFNSWLDMDRSMHADFDIQINEAFASQFAYCVEELGISMDKINPKYVC